MELIAQSILKMLASALLRYFKKSVVALLFLSGCSLVAQPLVISKTDETCPNNGTLTFNLQNPPSGTIVYDVFLLPDTVNPIVSTTQNTYSSCTAGMYQVNATVGGVTHTSSPITISYAIVPVTFTLAHSPASCLPDGSITATITGGTAQFYEIISGPETRPAQTSPLFLNLSAGTYDIRVTSACNTAYVIAHTVSALFGTVQIGSVSLPDLELPSCNTIHASNSLSLEDATQVIKYPLLLTYTVHPPNGGSAIVITQNVPSGPPTDYTATAELPFYYDTPYSYDLSITDGCGTTVSRLSNSIQQQMMAAVNAELGNCAQRFLSIKPRFFVPPFEIQFNSAPSGFSPAAFNSQYPGPYTAAPAHFGGDDQPVPLGNYSVTISDSCGRTASVSVLLEDEPLNIIAQIVPLPGCTSNQSNVTLTLPGIEIADAEIVQAPGVYPNALPHNVADLIEPPSELYVPALDAGTYLFLIYDVCGNVYEKEVIVNSASENVTFLVSTRGDCQPGKGSLRIRGSGSPLASITITQAPESYSGTVPQNLNTHLRPNGSFTMAGLPPGNYSFTAVNQCGFSKVLTDIVVPAYGVSSHEVHFTRHCGSFDIELTHASQNSAAVSYWLQRQIPVSGNWGHPVTLEAYPVNTLPNMANSQTLVNNALNSSFEYTNQGNFRILKVFESFENGTVASSKYCFEVLETFEMKGNVEITGLDKYTCDGILSNIQVHAQGVAPFNYEIIEKNGEPFAVDNGPDPVFTGLEAALYTFAVQDVCGNRETHVYDIAALPSRLLAQFPGNLVLCDEDNDNGEFFDLGTLSAAVLGDLPAEDFAVSYHLNAEDANSGANALPLQFHSAGQTLFVRLFMISNPDCSNTNTFELILNAIPQVQLMQHYGLCGDAPVTLSVASGYSGYVWSTGQTTPSITTNQPGEYSVLVTQNYADGSCAIRVNTLVIAPQPPIIATIEITDWTEANNSISVNLANPNTGDYLFALDDQEFQAQNSFEGLLPGNYTLTVKDRFGCYAISKEVSILMYPKFFTPNGDGHNELWKVKFAQSEPDLETRIFDRHGKLLTVFNTESSGWNGTLNGNLLPSSDYWFVVIRQDGTTRCGHFAMKR